MTWDESRYADALEYQTAAFEVLLDAKATGKKEDNQLFFCEHLPVLTIGKWQGL